MSFDERFLDRWTTLFEPALGSLRHNGVPVRPFRVDLSKTSDAILTEILGAIGDSLVIVGEVTALDELNKRPIRNANVMYEIGIAHATRLPEEVVLFRSDHQYLDFDISGVRVHHYDPGGDATKTRAFIADTVVASLGALQSRQRAILRVAAESLTLPATMALFAIVQNGQLTHPSTRTFGQAVGAVEHTQAIGLLLSVGAIRADMIKVTPEILDTLKAAPLQIFPCWSTRLRHLVPLSLSTSPAQWVHLSPRCGHE